MNFDLTLPHLRPSFWQEWYAIPLRLIIGYGFMAHGYAKLARGREHFTNILHVLGRPAPELLAWATIIVELLGGGGGGSPGRLSAHSFPWRSIPMAIVLLVATFTVHLPNGFSSIKLRSVTAVGACLSNRDTDRSTIPRLAIALVLGGSGPLALDRIFIRRLEESGAEDRQQNPGGKTSSMKRNKSSFRFKCGLN